MKKFILLFFILTILVGCIPTNVTIEPDYVSILFPQDKLQKEGYKDYIGKIFTPGIYQFPSGFFSSASEDGIRYFLLEYQIDDNLIMKYAENDQRDQKDHRLKFKDGTRLEADFKGPWSHIS